MLRVQSLSLLLTVAPLLLSIANAQAVTITEGSVTRTIECERFKQTGFWDVDIQTWSLPKECGPPLAFNAIRDRSKLPAQIGGLVGAYVFFLVATATLLLTWGRRMRKRVELATGQLKEIEMVNTSNHYGLASPAHSQRSWKHPFRGLKHAGSTSTLGRSPIGPKSPGLESVNSFDDRVLQKNRETAQLEMDRLYAAVAEHEEARRSQTAIAKAESRESMRSAAGTDVIAAVPKSAQAGGDGRKNLRVQISEVPPREIPNGPRSPISPRSLNSQGAPKSPYRAIYPPYPSPGQYSFTSSQPPITPMTPRTPYTPGLQRVELPDDMYPASPPPKQVRMQIPPPKSSDSGSSSKSKKLQQIKNLRIGSTEDMNAEDRQPLSPTTPSGMPPGYNEPLTARTIDTMNTIESEDYASERLDEPKPLPSSRPTLQIALPSSPKATRSSSGSNGSGLALRAFQNQHGGNDYPLSPGPVKQTILERKNDRIGRGPMTGRTPRTGVPMTPYTPYMPFTPITPVTPGLMSRKQRKERIKAEGRKVLVEEDEVVDEDEMWQG